MYSKIYVIDDEDILIMMHRMILNRMGLGDRVISFTNPEEALDHLRFNENKSESILVLLDINMPEMTGFEFLEFMVLENLPTTIDVAIVTSSISNEDKFLAKTFPQFVIDFISKPLSIEVTNKIVTKNKTSF
ncbi:two-component system response regulator [Cellulophaga sp. Hel_I_12]|uniref:response regulator n=1 Tax=Cellulophaga sp. Hel_I_12 TaxID=1249972 RepID=UPI000647BC54|nr:response regulator [Cellulophaga sp. Hel_I_12]